MIQRPSPNYNDRPEEVAITSIIIHATGMDGDCEAVIDRFANPETKVSAHYTIDMDGTVYHHVDPEKRAWHAGASAFNGLESFNDFSIGIELVNAGVFSDMGEGMPLNSGESYYEFPAVQIDALIVLIKDLSKAYPIKPEHVLGHSDISPERRNDPGHLFPWDRLVEEKLAVRPLIRI